MNTNFMHDDQKFKVVYGSSNTIWENAELDGSVDTAALHDGLWLAKDSTGKWVLATEIGLAHPILEMKYQHDNEAVKAVTVVRGSVPCVTTVYSYDFTGIVAVEAVGNYPAAPAVGQLLKAIDGVLMPVATDGSEDNYHVAIIEQVLDDRLVIIKRY